MLNTDSIETLNESDWPSHLLWDSKITLTLVLMDGCYLEGPSAPQQGQFWSPQCEAALISQGFYTGWLFSYSEAISRLCDIVQFESQGFPFFVFSSQDSSQIELLKELLDLQKDMIVMMLSLLEGLLFDDSTYKLSWHHPFFLIGSSFNHLYCLEIQNPGNVSKIKTFNSLQGYCHFYDRFVCL